MNDDVQIAAVLQAVGLDAAALSRKAQDSELKARLTANTQYAFDRGAFGAPTFFVGREIYFGKDRPADVEEALQARPKAA